MSAPSEKSMIYISNNAAEGIREEHSNGTANCNEYNYNVEINDIFVTSGRARENVMMHKAHPSRLPSFAPIFFAHGEISFICAPLSRFFLLDYL